MPSEEGSDLPEGLHYSTDACPGIRRRRAGKGFYYLDANGRKIRDGEVISRIKALAVPPAYEQVWICPSPSGHLQATGLDDRKRKQYRYHPGYAQWRNERKFNRLAGFARRLPRIRTAALADMRRHQVDRRKVLATAVYLLDTTAMRVGNRRYMLDNESYGLTTLQAEHVEIQRSQIRFHFKGKSGVERRLKVTHPSIAKVLRNCQELPGESLLTYRDENGEPHSICSHDVNEYLREISGAEVFAKDFRTWAGSLAALEFLLQQEDEPTKKMSVAAVKHAAKVLGNTPATCRKYYVHPRILETYLAGDLQRFRPRKGSGHGPGTLKPMEAALLRLIK